MKFSVYGFGSISERFVLKLSPNPLLVWDVDATDDHADIGADKFHGLWEWGRLRPERFLCLAVHTHPFINA